MHELARMVEETPAKAKKMIRDAFVRAGCDYEKTGKLLKMHHQTLRRHARALGITDELIELRARAIRRGELEDFNGRPPKPIPEARIIVRTYEKNGRNRAETAAAFGVTAPTLRRWIEHHELTLRHAADKDCA